VTRGDGEALAHVLCCKFFEALAHTIGSSGIALEADCKAQVSARIGENVEQVFAELARLAMLASGKSAPLPRKKKKKKKKAHGLFKKKDEPQPSDDDVVALFPPLSDPGPLPPCLVDYDDVLLQPLDGAPCCSIREHAL